MFLPHKTDDGAVHPWEYLPAAAGNYQVGQLLNAKSGVLTPISAASTTTPGYLCMADITAGEGENVPVTRIRHDGIYETRLSSDAAGAAVGTLLEISAGGLLADAGAQGSFEIVYIEDTAAGSVVRGRFR